MTAGIEAVSSVLASVASAASAPSSQIETTISGFASLMQPAVQASTDIQAAENSLSRLSSGESVEIHDVMIDIEHARLSVLTLIQIRNKTLEAYQELMRMQV